MNGRADAKACAKAVADIEGHVNALLGKDASDEDEEIIAGIGFGPQFYAKVGISAVIRS